MNKEAISIFISGDFAPTYRVNTLIQTGAYSKLYNDILPIIQKADISITNLELPLIERGTPITKTGPNLKAPLKSIEALKFAGFNVVTLANNHIMDYGDEGLFSTIKICKENNIDFMGAGASLNEAKQIKYIHSKNKRIAFINVAENEWSSTFGIEAGANPLSEVNMFYQISEAKQFADYVILIIHGGIENYELPSPRMKELYRYFVDLGADAVLGHHTHCYSGHEVYNGKLIFYSLGNFIFDYLNRRNNSLWNKGCALTLSLLDGKIDFQIHPFYQCNENIGIKLYDTKEAEEFIKYSEEKTNIIQTDELLKNEYNAFVIKQMRIYKSFLEPVKNKYIHALMNRGLFPRLISRYQKLLLLNLIRCESHRELLLSILSEKN